jgi:hypothetical protein
MKNKNGSIIYLIIWLTLRRLAEWTPAHSVERSDFFVESFIWPTVSGGIRLLPFENPKPQANRGAAKTHYLPCLWFARGRLGPRNDPLVGTERIHFWLSFLLPERRADLLSGRRPISLSPPIGSALIRICKANSDAIGFILIIYGIEIDNLIEIDHCIAIHLRMIIVRPFRTSPPRPFNDKKSVITVQV